MQHYRKNLGKVSLTAEGAWNLNNSYDILSIVYDEHTQHGFISRKAVPQGVDLYNKEYWMPINVSGYADNNVIILSKKTSEATIQSYTLEEAIASIKSVGRRPGAILGFYNENNDRLDIGGRWELWQFNDTNVYNWENVDSWQNLYYNYNKFMGWFKDENFLTKYAPFPEIGCYAFVGSEFNEATVYRCDNKYVWNNTTQHAWDYVKVIVDGNVTVGENGNWFNNGEDTGIPASVKGENGKTPVFREKDNTIQYSFDNVNWITISDKVAAWFRWNATTGDTQANNVGRIQISRDNVTWTNLSGDIINNLHISRYIGADETLPTSGIAEGTIYAKGPTYADGDTSHTNPIYRLWVYAWKGNTLAWQDNGEFTSIAAGVVQETGDSETEVMSQKAVSEKLSELGLRVKVNDWLIQGEYYDVNGTIQKASIYMRLPIIKASDKLAVIGFNTKIVGYGGVRAFNSTNEYIGDVVFRNNQEKDQIYTLPSGTAYVGIYFQTSVVIPDNAFIESPIGAMTELYMKSNDGLKGINILQDSSLWRGGYINSQGSVGIGSGDINIYKYVLIPVKEGETFLYWYQGIRNDLNCFFNSDIVKIGDNIVMQNGLNRLVVPKDSSYLGLTIQFGASDSYLYKWLVKDNTPIASIAKEAIEGNIFKIVKISDYLVKGSLWNPGGSLSSINTFDRTALIPATKGFYYIGCKINNVRCFDGDKCWISDEAISNDEYLQYVTLSEDTAYVGINFKVENQPDILYSDANLVIDSNPLVKPIFDKPNNLSYNSSVLTKKKWYFAGDSFSAGIGLEKFVDGIFSGKPKIYPYLIALRNGMVDLVNDGISGSAMTYQEGDSRTNNAYSVSRYKNIPSDADYITLYFGINDDNYQSPLGTIDDEVNTTFYGAWNVVMKHIITNHPLAKIGIIITNGSAPQYTAAERAIAKKYGVSYLDMELDDKIPHFLRQAEKVAALGIPADIVNLRTQTYALNPPSDTHPNEKAHEFESTFIEAWLKTL